MRASADDWNAALIARYRDNPSANLGAMRGLGQGPVDALPSGVALMVGDAFLRAGDSASAAGLFSIVLARREGQPLEGVASIGLGWAHLAQGDVATARLLFVSMSSLGDAADASDPNARTMLGLAQVAQLSRDLIDAYEGGGEAAALQLQQFAEASGTDFTLRPVALLSAAYARYWAGDYVGAASSFDVAARSFPDAATADDGRYGAAWSRWQAGDRESAIEDLESLSRETSRGGRARISRELVELDRNEIVRRGLRGDRRPVGSPLQRVVGALDLDGVRLARAALRVIRDEGDADEAAVETQPVGLQIAGRKRARSGERSASPASSTVEQGEGESAGGQLEVGVPPLHAAVNGEQHQASAPGGALAVREPDERGASGGWAPPWQAAALAATAIGVALFLRRRAQRP